MTTYLELDFSTFKEKMKEILGDSDTFKDFNYEGSNISIILDLLSYLMEFNTYYQNKIVDNIFFDTATLYNTVHRLANLVGYKPKGYVSPYTNLTVTVTGNYAGEQLFIPEYSIFKTEDSLEFITTKNYTISVPTSATDSYSFDIGVKEGTHEQLTYTGRDLVDYALFLPIQQYDNDYNIVNDEVSIKLYVDKDQNQEAWTRVPDIFQQISGLSSLENIYTFEYDKYQNYVIYFSFSRSYPTENQEITIDLIRTNGTDGDAGQNTITQFDNDFLFLNGTAISQDLITITNAVETRGSADPETVDEIKLNAKSEFNTQYRCVTKEDFKSYVEARNDVEAAHIWGEQEELQGEEVDPQLYNKTYISIIPDVWNSSTIETSAVTWNVYDGTTTSNLTVDKPYQFSSTFQYDLSQYLETRKLMNSFEVYVVPELIYFYFRMGLILKTGFNFNNVQNAIKRKIQYYFTANKRDFNEIIDFRDINNYVKDTSIASPYTDIDFSSIYGIKSLNFRDVQIINTSLYGDADQNTIYPYASAFYPRYTYEAFNEDYIDNLLRPIELGFNQFPKIEYNNIVIVNEG